MRFVEIPMGVSKISVHSLQGRLSLIIQIHTAPDKNAKVQGAVRLISRAAQMLREIVCALKTKVLLRRAILQQRLNVTCNAITRLDVGQIISVCSSKVQPTLLVQIRTAPSQNVNRVLAGKLTFRVKIILALKNQGTTQAD
jgi:hypothetical protein